MNSSGDLPRIRQVLFILDRNRNYKFDVNQTVTIRSLKKMIIAAANLGKTGLRIFHKGIEYTSYDENNLLDLFPDLQLVEFTISLVHLTEEEKESHIRVRFGRYCPVHNFKYPYFFCYDCKQSICSLCVQSPDHKSHNFIEKYDYLQSSKNLVESIFWDLKDTSETSKLDPQVVEELRSRIKVKLFPVLTEMVMKIELKLLDLVEFFNENEKISNSNMQSNVILLKQHCSEGLDKLKNEIAIEDMMMDEEIFLTFDKKFREISSEKNRIANDGKRREEMKTNLNSILTLVDTIYNDIFSFLEKYLKSKVYEEVKSKVTETSVGVISREDIFNKLLSDIKKRRKHILTESKYDGTQTTAVEGGFM